MYVIYTDCVLKFITTIICVLYRRNILYLKYRIHTGYDQRDVANALKRFLIGQFVNFFLLIGPSNALKHL